MLANIRCGFFVLALFAALVDSSLAIDIHHRTLESDVECIFLKKDIMYERGDLNQGPHSELDCELLPSTKAAEGRVGRTFKLLDLQNLPPEISEQELESGVDTLSIPSALIKGQTIQIPKGAAVRTQKRRKRADNFFDDTAEEGRRQLAQTGDKTVLVLRVETTGFRSAPTVSANHLSNAVFGTDGDPVNLVSQYAACSFGKLTFSPFETSNTSISFAAPGVIEVSIPTPQNYTRTGFEKDKYLVSEATEYLNTIFDNTFPFDFVMICLPADTMGGIAYAWKNGKRSVYKDVWATSVTSQLHEIGHGLGLAHAGSGLATEVEVNDYGDMSGVMGHSLVASDGPLVCFNAAKSWQLGWFADKHETIAPLTTAVWYGKLVGVAEYPLAGDNSVLLKLETNTTIDYYVGFNRKIGINNGTMEGQDMVLITEQGGDGESYSQSTKLAELDEGDKHIIADFSGSSATVTVTVNLINTATTPGFAIVTIASDTHFSVPTASPTSTGNPTDGSPSTSPTLLPTDDPTSSPSGDPSESPTSKPSSETSLQPSGKPSYSAAPTTGEPSEIPSLRPSISPRPSNAPSSSPSHKPTASEVPSANPSREPSPNPSGQPSHEPSPRPSSSHEPSLNPTDSDKPSNALSLYPSMKTSNVPSLYPSFAPSEVPITWNLITYDDFEKDNETNPTGWGSFNYTKKPGVRLDATRVFGDQFAAFIPQGGAAVRIRDDSGIYSSVFQDTDHDVSGFSNLRVSCTFLPRQLEDDEGFLLEYSSDSGTIWSLVKEWVIRSNTYYENGHFYHETVDFNNEAEQAYERTDSARIRFRCNATANRDPVFLDEILFEGYGPFEAP